MRGHKDIMETVEGDTNSASGENQGEYGAPIVERTLTPCRWCPGPLEHTSYPFQ